MAVKSQLTEQFIFTVYYTCNPRLVPTQITPPGQATLTITDAHSGPTLLPGEWYTVPITARDGVTQTISVRLLVGGARLYLPVVLKRY